jgi:hypothetical protein
VTTDEIEIVAPRARELAAWLRRMDVSDQIFLTGTMLVLRQIRERRDDLPVPFDETRLGTAPTPEAAARYATWLSAAYRTQPPIAAPDGVDEHWRISSMSGAFAARIERVYPSDD